MLQQGGSHKAVTAMESIGTAAIGAVEEGAETSCFAGGHHCK